MDPHPPQSHPQLHPTSVLPVSAAEAVLIDALIIAVTNELASHTNITAFAACSPSTLRILHSPGSPSRYSWDATVASAIELFQPLLSSGSHDSQNTGVRNLVAFMDYTLFRLSPLSEYEMLQSSNPVQYAVRRDEAIVFMRAFLLLISAGFKRLSSVEYILGPRDLLPDESDPSLRPEKGLLPYKSWLTALRRIIKESTDVGFGYLQSTDASIVAAFKEFPFPWLFAAVFCMFNYMHKFTMLLAYNEASSKALASLEGEIVSVVCKHKSLPRELLIFPLAYIGSHIKRLFSPDESQSMDFQASLSYVIKIFGIDVKNVNESGLAPDAKTIIPQSHVDVWRRHMLSYDFAIDDFQQKVFPVPVILRDVMLIDSVFSSHCQVEMSRVSASSPSVWMFGKQRICDPSLPDAYLNGIVKRFVSSCTLDSRWFLTRTILRALILHESLTKFCRPIGLGNRLEMLMSQSMLNSHSNRSVKTLSPISLIMQEIMELRYMCKSQPTRVADITACFDSLLASVISSQADLLDITLQLPHSFWICLREFHEKVSEKDVADSFMVILYSCLHRIEVQLQTLAENKRKEIKSDVSSTFSSTTPFCRVSENDADPAPSLFGFTWRTFFTRMHSPGFLVHVFTSLYKLSNSFSKTACLLVLEGLEADLCNTSDSIRTRTQSAFSLACICMLQGDLSCISLFPEDVISSITSHDLSLAYLNMTDLAAEYSSVLFNVNHSIRVSLASKPTLVEGEVQLETGEIGEEDDENRWSEFSEVTTLGILYNTPLDPWSLKRSPSHSNESRAAKQARLNTRPNLLLVDGILDLLDGKTPQETLAISKFLDVWNTLACTLPILALHADLDDILTNYYPSDLKRILDQVLAEFVTSHSWIVADVVDMLKLGGSGKYSSSSTLQTPPNIPSYNRRQAPYYAFINTYCCSTVTSSFGEEGATPHMGITIGFDFHRQADKLPVTHFLRELRRRIVTDHGKSKPDIAVFGKSNAAVRFVADLIHSAPEAVGALFFHETFGPILSSNDPMPPAPGKGKIHTMLPLVFASGLLKLGTGTTPKLRRIAAGIFLFGRLDVLDTKTPHPILHRAAYQYAMYADLFQSFLITSGNLSSPRRDECSDIMRAFLIAPLGSNPEQANSLGKRLTKVCRMYYTNDSSGLFLSTWLSPIVNTILELGNRPHITAVYLLQHILAPSNFYLQTASTPNDEPVAMGRDILDDWLHLLADVENHANFHVLLGIWRELMRDTVPNELLQLLCRCSVKCADTLCDFLAEETQVLLKQKPSMISHFMERVFQSDAPVRTFAMAKTLMPSMSTLLPLKSETCKFIERKVVHILELNATDTAASSSPIPFQQHTLDTLLGVLGCLIEWDAGVGIQCLAQRPVADFFVSCLLSISGRQAKDVVVMLSAVYKAVLSRIAASHSTNSLLPLAKQFASVHESTWRVYVMRILKHLEDQHMSPLLHSLFDALLSCFKACSYSGFSDILVQCASSTISFAIHNRNTDLLISTLELLSRILEQYPGGVVCESVYYIILAYGVEVSGRVEASVRHLVLAMLPKLYTATHANVESVVLVGALQFLSSSPGISPKSLLLDIVERCCQLKLNRGELLCSLDYIMLSLTGGHHDTYLRAVTALKMLRVWAGESPNGSDRDPLILQKDGSEGEKPRLELSWANKATQDSKSVDRRLLFTTQMFDAIVAKCISNLVSSSTLLGEKAYLSSAQSRIISA
ncbi:hypothetical protein BASA83_005542 [Batrachochytrium salamandrivorans]|nr:hypothetical protein BASA81_005954 [Batrachochytrium salamandrivorans]KAH9272201.1 hypothetical protein BASA83_005542 [Batrachochytrium salamandrivorans]